MNAYHTYSDKELFNLTGKGDEAAFKELYNRYWEKLLAIAFLKIKNYEEAEEIVQEIFVGIWRRRKTTRIKYSFHTYIASVLKYEVLHHFAKKKKKDFFLESISNGFVQEDVSTTEWLEYDQLREQIEKTVRLLPEKCRIIFRLSREKGYSEKEISEELNIAPKTVQAHLTKALKVLKSSLNFMLFLPF